MDRHPDIDKPARARRWRAQATMTLAAWLIAFLLVMALSTLFNDELTSLPLPLRALVLSGVLVALMVNLVMPLISAALSRRLPSPPDTTRVQRQRPRLEPHETSRIDNASAVEPTQ
jgi:antibiotic biosynthesis monooxygenase (ABM) superfamily enzyme